MEKTNPSEIHSNIHAIQAECDYYDSLILMLEDKLGYVIQPPVPTINSNNTGNIPFNINQSTAMQSTMGSITQGIVQDMKFRNARLQDIINRVQL